MVIDVWLSAIYTTHNNRRKDMTTNLGDVSEERLQMNMERTKDRIRKGIVTSEDVVRRIMKEIVLAKKVTSDAPAKRARIRYLQEELARILDWIIATGGE
jgi:ribosomal protein S25